MDKLFNPNNPIIRFLSRFTDIMLLNILFLLTCIPIFTIGAALSAMYGVTLKWMDDEDPYVAACYFHNFKSCFCQATLLWLPLLFAGVFFGADLFIIYHLIDPGYSYLQFPVWFFIFIIVSLVIYAFPLLSTYECGTKQLLKNAVLLSIANFPTTVFFVVLSFGIFKFATLSAKNLVLTGSLFLFFGFAACAYFCSLFLYRIFAKCAVDESDENTENSDDPKV